MTRSRHRAFIALGACAAALVAIVVLAVVLSENVVYFRTVSEAVDQRKSQGDDRFRMAGEVVAGSVRETKRGVQFEISDGNATAVVLHKGDTPSLFEPGAPVVCEGRWGSRASFESDRIMIRHGNDYSPPDVKATGDPSA